jgi:hypothetical protein
MVVSVMRSVLSVRDMVVLRKLSSWSRIRAMLASVNIFVMNASGMCDESSLPKL